MRKATKIAGITAIIYAMNIIYRKYSAFKDFEVIAELLMIEKHFEKLLKDDIISKEKDGYISN